MESMWTTLFVVIYLFIVGYLGYRGYRGTRTVADYLVGGRKIHPYVMAMSYGATFISTSAIVGFGGAAGVFGMGLLWLTFLNIFVGIFMRLCSLAGAPIRWGCGWTPTRSRNYWGAVFSPASFKDLPRF